jgi:hypothetical protein
MNVHQVYDIEHNSLSNLIIMKRTLLCENDEKGHFVMKCPKVPDCLTIGETFTIFFGHILSIKRVNM